MTYTVSMENTRNGNPKKVTIQAADRFEAEAIAEMKYRGFAATDSKIVLAAGEQPADLFLIMRVTLVLGTDLKALPHRAEGCYTRMCKCSHMLITHAVSGRCIAKDCVCKTFVEVLSPCPFCGSFEGPYVERADYSSCYAVCNNCSARGPVKCQESGDEDRPGEIEAIKAWDLRL